MKLIELQHDEFSDQGIQEFWESVKTIDYQGISPEFNSETTTLAALKINWISEGQKVNRTPINLPKPTKTELRSGNTCTWESRPSP